LTSLTMLCIDSVCKSPEETNDALSMLSTLNALP